jgi:hypothetical protein
MQVKAPRDAASCSAACARFRLNEQEIRAARDTTVSNASKSKR